MGEHPIKACTCDNARGEYCNRCMLDELDGRPSELAQKASLANGGEEVIETVQPATDTNVLPFKEAVSRQQRRAAERAREKEQAALEKAAEETLATDDPRLKPLLKARHMLFAMAREHGRVRIKATHLNVVTTADKLDVRVQPNGDLVVSFVEGG